MRNVTSALVLLIALTAAGPAQPQRMGSASGGEPMTGISGAECDQLANMPNAPISAEACRSMMEMARSYERAAADPHASRPGDEALTCAQLFAELKTMRGVGLSDATTRQAAASVEEGVALAQRQAAEISALVAQTIAMGAAAGAIDLALTLATGGFGGGQAAAIASLIFIANATALATKQQADARPVRGRMNQTMVAGSGELSRSLEANPRFARLGQLAMNQSCPPPDM